MGGRQENNIEQWIIAQNIKRYVAKLEENPDEGEQEMLRYLLELERQKVRKANGNGSG